MTSNSSDFHASRVRGNEKGRERGREGEREREGGRGKEREGGGRGKRCTLPTLGQSTVYYGFNI